MKESLSVTQGISPLATFLTTSVEVQVILEGHQVGDRAWIQTPNFESGSIHPFAETSMGLSVAQAKALCRVWSWLVIRDPQS